MHVKYRLCDHGHTWPGATVTGITFPCSVLWLAEQHQRRNMNPRGRAPRRGEVEIMTQQDFHPNKNSLIVYDCLAFLVGALFAVPFLLVLTLPLIADF
jgi:hypothetical protein